MAKKGLLTTGPWHGLGEAATLLYRVICPARPAGTDPGRSHFSSKRRSVGGAERKEKKGLVSQS
jgi:hypothetical protein